MNIILTEKEALETLIAIKTEINLCEQYPEDKFFQEKIPHLQKAYKKFLDGEIEHS